LWTPVDKALPVTAEGFNHHFFGIEQQHKINLIRTNREQEATALLAGIAEAGELIERAPAIRLEQLKWVLCGEEEVLITGTPLLPLNGKTFWRKGSFLFPAGYDLELPILEDLLAKKTDEGGTHIIWWKDAEHYKLLKKEWMQPLSIASWRQTMGWMKKNL
jgi:hypothetical protein